MQPAWGACPPLLRTTLWGAVPGWCAVPADVAESLGISANAVYLAKGRILARLREEFWDLLEP
jgi:hypothetical protein